MNSLNAHFDRAAGDRRHGAVEIERRLISGLLADPENWTAPGHSSGARRLLEGQPAMTNLRNLVSTRISE